MLIANILVYYGYCVAVLLTGWLLCVSHVGDLGNVIVTNGKVETTITDRLVSLYGSRTVIGRSIVVCIDSCC